MPIINGRPVRELFIVKFRSKKNEGKGRAINFVDIQAMFRIWALDGDDALKRAKEFAREQSLPWLGLTGLDSVDLIESHIINQPKSSENEQMVQPPTDDSAQGLEQLNEPAVESPDETQDHQTSDRAPSTPAGLILLP